MSDIYREIGSILNRARLKLGLTQKRLSERGLPRGIIVSLERGERLPPPSRVKEIARVYELNEQEFLGKLKIAWEEHERLIPKRKKSKKPKQSFSGEIESTPARLRLNQRRFIY